MNNFDIYTKQIQKYYKPIENLTVQKELFEAYHNGSRKAYNHIFYSALNFVISTAKKYCNQGVPFEDLIQAGNLSLDKAIKEFDHTKELKFISYAIWWIRQGMLQELANNSRFLNITTGKSNQMNLINKASDKLKQKLSRTPTPEEISKETKINVDEIKVLEILKPQSSLEDKVGESLTLKEVLKDETFDSPEIFEQNSISSKMCEFVDNSTIKKEEHKKILKDYFGITTGVSFELTELAEKYSYSSEMIRQIKNKGIETLKHFNKNQQRDNQYHLTPDLVEG